MKIPSKIVPVIGGKRYPKENVISVTPEQEKIIAKKLGHKGRIGEHGIKHFPPVSNSDAGVAETKASGGKSPGNTGNTGNSYNGSGNKGPAGAANAPSGGGGQGSQSNDSGNKGPAGAANGPGGQGNQTSNAPDRNAGQPRDQKTGAAPGDQGIAGLKDGLGIGARATTTAYKARDDRMPSTSDAMKKTVASTAPKKNSSITDYKGLTKVASLDDIAPFSNIFGKTARETPVPAKADAMAPVGDESYFGSLMSNPPSSGTALAMRQATLDNSASLDALNDALGVTKLDTSQPQDSGLFKRALSDSQLSNPALGNPNLAGYRAVAKGVDAVGGLSNEEQVDQALKALGVKDMQRAAMMGRFNHESMVNGVGFDQGVMDMNNYYDGANLSQGVAQWRNSPSAPRLDNVKDFMRSIGSPDFSPAAQAAAAINEMNTTERAAYDKLNAATTVKEAMQAMNAFERQKNWNTAKPLGMKPSMAYANKHYAETQADQATRIAAAKANQNSQVASGVPTPQPKPASAPDITKPANVEPHIAVVDQAVKDALKWAAEKAGSVVKTINPFDSPEPTRIAATGVTQASPPAAPPSTFPARPATIASNTAPAPPSTFPARPSVVASNAVPTKKADYRVNEDGTITDLRTNTEISQTPNPNVTEVPKQVAAAVPTAPATRSVTAAPPSSFPARPSVIASNTAAMPSTPAPVGPTNNLTAAEQAELDALPSEQWRRQQEASAGVPVSGPAGRPAMPSTLPGAQPPTGNYTPEEIAASKAMTDEMNRAALKDTEVPTADEVFDAREQNLNVLADDPTALDKAKKVGSVLKDFASVLANPVVGIFGIGARETVKAIKRDQEKLAYLKENYPATYAAEMARRGAQSSRMSSRNEGGDNRIFETKTGVTMSEDDMDLIGSLPDAERQRLVRLSKTNPSVFQAELASIRSASSSPTPASTNANQLQQIFAAFV